MPLKRSPGCWNLNLIANDDVPMDMEVVDTTHIVDMKPFECESLAAPSVSATHFRADSAVGDMKDHWAAPHKSPVAKTAIESVREADNEQEEDDSMYNSDAEDKMLMSRKRMTRTQRNFSTVDRLHVELVEH
ncbi:hypothetical protein RI367_000077 [Sorochytrium milnesiophthora]